MALSCLMFIQLTKDKFAYASDPLILYCLGFCAGLWLFSRFFFFFDSGTLQHGAAVSHEIDTPHFTSLLKPIIFYLCFCGSTTLPWNEYAM